MANLFLPDIARVVDIGKSVVFGDKGAIEDLKKSAAHALEFVINFENIFLNLSSGFYRNDEVDELINFTKQDLAQLKKVLKEIEPVLDKERFIELNPILYSLEKYSARLAHSIEKFSALREINTPESPIPVINRIIKLSYNISEGKSKKEELNSLFPVIASFAGYAELEVERFAILHKEEKEIIKSGKKLIADLQRGVGALAVYLKEDTPSALVDSIRIFKFTSTAIYLLLRKMDLVISSDNKYSKLPAVSEFVRAYNLFKEDKIDKIVLLTALNALDRLVVFYNEAIDSVRKSYYYYYIEPICNAAVLLTDSFNSFWRKFFESARKLSLELDIKELCEKFEGRAKDVEKVTAAHENEIRKVSSAPFIEEIKELTGRYLSGTLVLEYYSSRLEAFSQNHRALTDEFKSKSISSELAKEVCQLLDMQREGIDEMLLFLENSKKEHLINGIFALESPLPRLLEIHKGTAPPTIKKIELLCPSCSKPYKQGDKNCPSCSAILPLYISEEGASQEESEQLLPSKLKSIVNSIAKLKSEKITKDDLLPEIRSYKRILGQIRGTYNSMAKNFAKSSSIEVRDCSEEFISNFELLESALDGLLDAIESGGDPEGPLSQLVFAGKNLEDLRNILRESKRVIK